MHLTGWDGASVHHRTPRGMGGSKNPALSQPANLLLLCGSGVTGCHGWTESNRTKATDRGLLVRRRHDPAEVPFADIYGQQWLLDNQGGKAPYRPRVD